MAKSEERRRVLDMLAAGQINAEQAATILKALGPTPAEAMSRPAPRVESQVLQPPRPPEPSRRGKTPRLIKIQITSDDDSGKGDVNVNVPYALAKFALRFVPQEARTRLEREGIDLASLFESVDDELPDGKLIDITTDKSDGSGRAQITIEVI